MKYIVHHSGYHSCERCTIKGARISGRIVFCLHEDGIRLRTAAAFRNQDYGIADNGGKCHQHVETILLRLNGDMINAFALPGCDDKKFGFPKRQVQGHQTWKVVSSAD